MGNAPSYSFNRARAERDALRLLCSDHISPDARVRLSGLLEVSNFKDELHQVVFQEIARLGLVPARRMRELLPGRVTLQGFPDFELKEFLARDGTEDNIDKLFESLLDLTEAGEPGGQNQKALGQSA